MINFIKRHKVKIIFLFTILLIISTQIQPTRAFYQAALTAIELINSPIKPLAYLTNKPKIKEVIVKSSNREIQADLYMPSDREKHPAAVLDLGIDIDRRDPRVINIAKTFARDGFIVLTPNIPYLSSRRFTRSAIEDFITSYNYLEHLPNVKKDKIGFVGFCTSGGLTLLAAENNKIKDKVSFAFVINPFFDLNTLYKAITTRQVNGQKWIPHFKTVEVYNRETIFLINNPRDQLILFTNLIGIKREDLSNGNFPTLSEADKKTLTESGKFVYDGLTNRDPQMSNFYLKNATETQKKFLKEMSPSTEIQKINAKVYIFAERGFNYIPYTEARTLATTLKGLNKKYTYQETSLFPAYQGPNTPSPKNKDYFIQWARLAKLLFRFLREVN